MRRKKNKTKKIVYSFFLIIALLSGIIIGKFIDWPFFKIDEHVNLVDLFSLIITLLIAYFIARVIEKEKEDDRAEKDLIISKLADSFPIIDSLNEKIEGKKILYIEATSKIKKINMDVTCAFNGLEISSIRLDDLERDGITKKIRKLKNLITNTPTINQQGEAKPNEPLQVERGIIHISDSRAIEIESELGKLRNEIFLLQMKINSF